MADDLPEGHPDSLSRPASVKQWRAFTESWRIERFDIRTMPVEENESDGYDVTVGALAKVLGDWVKWRHDECHESPCEHDRELARVLLGYLEE